MTPTRGGRPLAATMTGASERPGPGDPDVTGTATIRVTPGLGRVCFVLNVANITLPAAAAHIHIAPPTDPGPIVVTLVAPDASGTSQGCVSTTRALVKAILKNPSAYYVNVHTSDYPAGAVRGQLGKWRGPPSGAAQESNLPSRGLHDRTGLKVCVPRSCWCAVPRTNGLEVPLGRVRSAQVGTNTGTKVADVTTRTAR
jgi:CHRD domain